MEYFMGMFNIISFILLLVFIPILIFKSISYFNNKKTYLFEIKESLKEIAKKLDKNE